MARLLLVHHDKAIRNVLQMMAACHQVVIARDVTSGIRQILDSPPEVILVGQDSRQDDGMRLLKWLRQNVLAIPVIVLLGRTGAAHKPAVLKLGAAATLEHPFDQHRLNEAVAAALHVAKQAAAGPPSLTEEELESNLSSLEYNLNSRMQCFAGKNQVFIHSMLLGTGTTRPRICLKCSLRAEYGLPREVYYEFIRDICCGDFDRCQAVRRFRTTREIA